MVEVARLESVYRFIAYRGFESPSLRQEHKCKEGHPRVAFLHLCSWRREARPLRALRGGFEGLGVFAQPAPNRPIATALRWRAGGAARSAISYPHYFL